MAQRGRIAYGMHGLGEALAAAEYEVPIYQRSYAWKLDVVEDFFKDLLRALNNGDPDYFLGSLVLTQNEQTNRTTIIDGQQRLATTTLFMAALRDALRESGSEKRADEIHRRFLASLDRDTEAEVPRLLLNEDDQLYFSELVLGPAEPTPMLESHDRLVAAEHALAGFLADDVARHGNNGNARLVDWWNFVEKRATVITVTVESEADAFIIFEALNARGEGLTIGDLLKNLLFMHAGGKLSGVKASWINALSALDITAENEDFVTFLRHHWTSTHGEPVRERDLYRAIRDEVTSQARAVAYATELEKSARLYAAILSSSHAFWGEFGAHAAAMRSHVDTLQRLGLGQNRPLLLAVMQHFSKAELRKTLKALVSWGVRGLVVGGIGGGKTEAAYAEASKAVRDGEVRTARGLLKALSAVIASDDVFERDFSTARQNRGAIARYLLVALERAELGQAQPELVPNTEADAVNLEHILPRNAKDSDWGGFRPDERAYWTYRLGNQVLLQQRSNAWIGNKPWTVKKPELAKSALALTKRASSASAWDKAAIDRQQKHMAKLALTAWPREP